jgi:uncharacterized spore protein YtfJ
VAKSDAEKAVRFGPLRRVLDAASGASLCFGEPVGSGDRTVVPVARVRGAGGFGSGRGTDGSSGNGGGGWLEAQPVGFVEIGPEGARFQRIPADPLGGTLKAVTALATLAAGIATARRRGDHAPRLLRAGRR